MRKNSDRFTRIATAKPIISSSDRSNVKKHNFMIDAQSLMGKESSNQLNQDLETESSKET